MTCQGLVLVKSLGQLIAKTVKSKRRHVLPAVAIEQARPAKGDGNANWEPEVLV
jgi:hypothetical protein